MSELATKSGTLKHGMKIGEAVHKDFVIREATAGDIFNAEEDATGERPTTHRAAILARQLVRVGTFEGPFTLSMISKLRAGDLAALLRAQMELDREGEDEPLGTATS